MRMVRRFCENIFHNAFGEFTRALILLQDDEYGHAGFYVRSFLSVHGDTVVGTGVAVGGCGVNVIVGGNVFVGMVGTEVSVGTRVGTSVGGSGVMLGVRVGSGVGVGRLKVRKTRFSA